MAVDIMAVDIISMAADIMANMAETTPVAVGTAVGTAAANTVALMDTDITFDAWRPPESNSRRALRWKSRSGDK